MRAQDIFEICLERYRNLRGWLDGRISAIQLDVPAASGGYQWRPERARAADYVADFESAGERALARPTWKGRRRLFKIYFCWGMQYRQAITMLGVPSGTFDYWAQEVKKTVGKEFDRAGLFPPGGYFRPRRQVREVKSQESRRLSSTGEEAREQSP